MDDKFNIYGTIDQVMANEFKTFMQEHRDSEEVVLNIDSPGGDLMAALMMYRELEQYPGKTIAQVEFCAASCAGFLALACDELRVNETSALMLHKPWTTVCGNADDLREIVDLLDKWGSIVENIIKEKVGLSDDDLEEIFSKDSWFTAQDCIDKFKAVFVKVADMVFNKAHFVELSMTCKDVPDYLQAKMQEEPAVEEEPQTEEEPADEDTPAEEEPEQEEEQPADEPEEEPEKVVEAKADYSKVDQLFARASKLGF